MMELACPQCTRLDGNSIGEYDVISALTNGPLIRTQIRDVTGINDRNLIRILKRLVASGRVVANTADVDVHHEHTKIYLLRHVRY